MYTTIGWWSFIDTFFYYCRGWLVVFQVFFCILLEWFWLSLKGIPIPKIARNLSPWIPHCGVLRFFDTYVGCLLTSKGFSHFIRSVFGVKQGYLFCPHCLWSTLMRYRHLKQNTLENDGPWLHPTSYLDCHIHV